MKIVCSCDEKKNDHKLFKKNMKQGKNMGMMERISQTTNCINTLQGNITLLESDIATVLLSIPWFFVKR